MSTTTETGSRAAGEAPEATGSQVPDRVLFFDGECALCHSFVRFALDKERDRRLHFAALQSSAAARLLPPLGIDPATIDQAVLLLDAQTPDARCFTGGRAICHVAPHLRFPWSLLSAFRILPSFVLEGVYGFVARRRRRLAGSSLRCALPPPGDRGRFLDAPGQ